MESYFNIRYEFDREAVVEAIDRRLREPGSDYICVADGVILTQVNCDENYRKVVNGGMFAICDSSYVPIYVKMIYGRERNQYCGSQIFEELVKSRRYRMLFMGTSQHILDGLRRTLTSWNEDVGNMTFHELPFCSVDEFDYPAIARMVENDGADIVWVALGAPKQEEFMYRLKPHLSHGVMIAVGAAFKFFSGVKARRAPRWMVKSHTEFVYRILTEPKKQIRRCGGIVANLPRILHNEMKVKKNQK